MEQWRLERTGQAPLAFEGERLADSGGRLRRGKEHNRWHDLAIYRTIGGKYVVHAIYHTCWDGEAEAHWAGATDAAGNLELLLREAEVELIDGERIGYPATAGYEEKQARMLADLRARYEDQVREVLAAVPGTEEHVD